jgi:hypothetical protein
LGQNAPEASVPQFGQNAIIPPEVTQAALSDESTLDAGRRAKNYLFYSFFSIDPVLSTLSS